MQIRRPLLIAAAAVMVVSAAGVGAYAYASSDTDSPVDTAPLEDHANAPTETEPEPEPSETATPTTAHDCGDTGQYQEQVETILFQLGEYGEVFVDGEQSKEDCDAITKFQKRFGIEPSGAYGYAGELTHQVAERIDESAFGDCESGEGIVVCVDLTHQTLWVTDDGVVVFDPTVVRTGMPGYNTQTGVHQIANKAESEWSVPYKVWLPYWQRFYMGQGLHQTTSYIHNAPAGSHGCVNLLPDDAVELYELLESGDTIHVFGNRPGT